MIYGYARVSTKGQAKDGNSLEGQETVLKEAGAEIIFSDVFTGTKAHRPELDKLLSQIKDGDKLIVTKLDRVGCYCPYLKYGNYGQYTNRKINQNNNVGFCRV